MILTEPWVDPGALARATGWERRPEGLCRGGVCVPLPAGAVDGRGRLDAAVVAERLGAPLVADPARGAWALGPEGGGRALASAVAPDLVLPDLDGRPWSLSSRRGRRTVLLAWASW